VPKKTKHLSSSQAAANQPAFGMGFLLKKKHPAFVPLPEMHL